MTRKEWLQSTSRPGFIPQRSRLVAQVRRGLERPPQGGLFHFRDRRWCGKTAFRLDRFHSSGSMRSAKSARIHSRSGDEFRVVARGFSVKERSSSDSSCQPSAAAASSVDTSSLGSASFRCRGRKKPLADRFSASRRLPYGELPANLGLTEEYMERVSVQDIREGDGQGRDGRDRNPKHRRRAARLRGLRKR